MLNEIKEKQKAVGLLLLLFFLLAKNMCETELNPNLRIPTRRYTSAQ